MLGIDLTQILQHLLNVVILFVGLYILLYSPVKKFMEKREQHYKDVDDEAVKKLEEANGLKAEYEKKLENADGEIAEKKQQANEEITALRKNAESDARAQAAKIISDAKKDAENKKDSIITGAKDEIIKMVEDATQKVILTGNVSEAYDLFLDDAERSAE